MFLPCFKDPRSRSAHLQLQRFTTQSKLRFFIAALYSVYNKRLG